jgi:hypothetical protein
MNWQFAGISALSFGIYLGLSASLNKPLTTGELERLYAQKIKLLDMSGPDRLFILAGSTGRFSHSCVTIGEALGRPCGNLSIAAGIGLDFIFESYLPKFHEGDTVYMPLEIPEYQRSQDELLSGPENEFLLKRHPELLRILGARRAMHTAFFADSKYFIQSTLETLLARRGVRRRFTEASVNALGDQQGHTPELGAIYQESIRQQRERVPTLDLASPEAFSSGVIRSFLKRARAKGVRIIGGITTSFVGTQYPESTLAYIRRIYESEGHEFLLLRNRSQYDRGCFFDTGGHLNAVCQVVHSKIVASELGALLRAPAISSVECRPGAE